MTKGLEDSKEISPEQYWEERYRRASPQTSGKPGEALRRFAEPLKPGRALELGCGKGDDAVWLAKSGWMVVAVEISATALSYAAANAERAGVKDRVTLEQHDLSRTFPDGHFDLVAASFLAAEPRENVFRRGAAAVAPRGHLLIIDHAARLPWSSAPPDRKFLTAEETLADIGLGDNSWTPNHVGTIERQATDPGGNEVTVRDNVIFLRRL